MKSFSEWTRDLAAEISAPAADELPEGIVEVQDGKYEAKCCCCEEWREIFCDISEIPDTGYVHYCGGSPWCCP
jgi:hypothetical protein